MKINRFHSVHPATAPALATPGRTKLSIRDWDGILDPRSDWELMELGTRALAGLWAARVALVASVPFGLVAWAQDVENAWLTFMLLPVVAAFFAGALLGAGLVHSREIADECLAGRRGVLIALSAYLIYAAEVAAMSHAPVEALLNVFMASVIVSGWLVFPISFFAGMMAFRAHEGALRYRLGDHGPKA